MREMGDGAFMPEVGVESWIETETVSEEAVVVTVHGEADLHFAPVLKDKLDAVIDGGAKRVLVDLSNTVFIDSMGLGVLLGSTRRMRTDGHRLDLIVTSPDLRRIFEITMLDRVFVIHPSRTLALETGDGGAV